MNKNIRHASANPFLTGCVLRNTSYAEQKHCVLCPNMMHFIQKMADMAMVLQD